MIKKQQLPIIKLRSVVRAALFLAGSAVLFFSALFFAVYTGVFGRLGTVEELENIQNHLASEIYSNEKVLLGKYYYQDRTNTPYREIPGHLVDALIATEDVRFYSHNGIDRKSSMRVVVKSLLLQRNSSGGGSTIHQQLAKNLFPRGRHSVLAMPVNKFREMIIGVRLDRAYSKQEILELYLNTVSFGENTFGIETAAKRFFNKKPQELKTEESALLVGMLKGTSAYHPVHHPDRSVSRRNLVLSQMARHHFLDQKTADSLGKLPMELDYVRLSHNEGLAPYFREHLRMDLLRWARENPKEDGSQYNIYTDGLKIYTTINADLQRYAEEAVQAQMTRLQGIFDRQWQHRDPLGNQQAYITSHLQQTRPYQGLEQKGLSEDEIIAALRVPKKTEIFTWEGMKEVEMSVYDSVVHYLKFLHAGLLSMEARTGYVRAWVGGIRSEYFKYDHVTSKRQAGSVFKPVVYAAALRNGFTPCTYLPNDSVVYEEYNRWTPKNTRGGYGGYYSLKGALTHSVNTISVRLLEETGIDKVMRLSEQLGITGKMPEVLSLALGTGEVSLEELVQVYSAFLNEGRTVKPIYLKRIEDKSGNVLYAQAPVVSEAVISRRHALEMTEMLKNVVDNGTAASLRTVYGFDNEIAGKTGTTQGNTDGWFIGYTPVLITGVWIGGDHPRVRFRYGGYGQGAGAALPVWARYMQKIYRDPLYRHSKTLSFGIPVWVQTELDCEDYLDPD
ncbi:MAG: transglycosylase domain-containing protein [Bacteroidales bacterium]|nr:transglycosylase domain-containing protein [Bacteroidales bacterium]MDT8432687.1 transglycosylase domain-containing protein [Bacteroidales bacterium]